MADAVELGKQQGLDKDDRKKKITEAEQKFANDLCALVKKDDDDRQLWKRKLVNATQQRQGMVRIRNWPWIGAAEYATPFTDKTIRKLKSLFVLSAVGNKKWVTVKPKNGVYITPQMRASCKKIEKVINSILQDPNQRFVEKLTILIDNMLEKGKFVAKCRAKFNVRPVTRTIFIDEVIQTEIQKQVIMGTIPMEQAQQLDLQQITEEFRSKDNVELYSFLIQRYGFDIESDDDVVIMDDIIKRFKKGESEIQFEMTEVTQRPDVVPVQLENLIVSKGTTDIHLEPRITQQYWATKQQLKLAAERGVYIKSVIDSLPDNASKNDDPLTGTINSTKAGNEGIENDTTNSGRFRVIECCAFWKNKPYMFTFLPSMQNKLIRKPHPVPYDFEELDEVVWPYVVNDWEVKDGRYYSSRGVPEMLQSVQSIIDQSLNNMINRDIINNTPMFFLSGGTPFDNRKIRFIPGQIIRGTPEGKPQRFETGAAADISSERIAQFSKAFGEEYMGSIDFTFNNATNSGGAKTATEVTKAGENAALLPQLDSLLLFDSLSQIAMMLFSIFKQRFGRPIFIDGIQITKADLEVPCDIRWNGSLEQADKQLQASKSYARIQMLVSAKQAGQFVNDEDIYNAFYDWLDNDGVNDPDRYITNPSEQAQQQIVQLQQQIQQMQQEVINLNGSIDILTKELGDTKEDLVEEEERVELETLRTKFKLEKERIKGEADIKTEKAKDKEKK